MMTRCFLITLLLVLNFGLGACAGPNPAVVRQELQSPQIPGGVYVLIVTVANRSRGEGQIEVTARLRSHATGNTAATQDRSLDLMPHETAQVRFELQPDSPGDYDATVEAKYPPY